MLYAAGVDSPVAYGACLVVGYLAAAIWPSSLRFGRDGSPPDPGSPLALVGGVGLGQLLAQATLTGGPVLLAVAGGAPAEVTAIFAGLALFRAPYTLAVGLVAALTGRLTAQVVQGRWAALRRFRTLVVVVALVAAAVGAPLAAWIGPPLMSAVFGAGIRLPGDLTAVLAVGTVFAMANLVLTILVVARGRSAALVRGWLVGLVPGAAYFAWAGGDSLERDLLDLPRRRGRGVRVAGRRGRRVRAAPLSACGRPGRPMSRTAGRADAGPCSRLARCR